MSATVRPAPRRTEESEASYTTIHSHIQGQDDGILRADDADGSSGCGSEGRWRVNVRPAHDGHCS